MSFDRIDFVNRLGFTSSDFNRFFDVIMSMYELIHYNVDINNTSISYTIENEDSIQLNLELENKTSATQLKENIKYVRISNYENIIYSLDIIQNNNKLYIHFIRVSV